MHGKAVEFSTFLKSNIGTKRSQTVGVLCGTEFYILIYYMKFNFTQTETILENRHLWFI